MHYLKKSPDALVKNQGAGKSTANVSKKAYCVESSANAKDVKIARSSSRKRNQKKA